MIEDEPYWHQQDIECRDVLDVCPRCGALIGYWRRGEHTSWHQEHNDWPWDVAE